MRTYLRQRSPGGLYFFTVNLAERRGNRLLVDRIDALQAAFRTTRAERPFAMPFHYFAGSTPNCCITDKLS